MSDQIDTYIHYTLYQIKLMVVTSNSHIKLIRIVNAQCVRPSSQSISYASTYQFDLTCCRFEVITDEFDLTYCEFEMTTYKFDLTCCAFEVTTYLM